MGANKKIDRFHLVNWYNLNKMWNKQLLRHVQRSENGKQIVVNYEFQSQKSIGWWFCTHTPKLNRKRSIFTKRQSPMMIITFLPY